MMAWKTVRGSYPDTEHVKFRTLPEVTVASCTYQGSYTQITDVYAAVIAWMEANGYEPAEPMFNIYHISPHETQNPDEFVTEICYPVKKKYGKTRKNKKLQGNKLPRPVKGRGSLMILINNSLAEIIPLL